MNFRNSAPWLALVMMNVSVWIEANALLAYWVCYFIMAVLYDLYLFEKEYKNFLK